MMYIIEAKSISPQDGFDYKHFTGEIKGYFGDRYQAIEPSYKEIIPVSLLRRMGRGVKMGLGVGLPLLEGKNDLKAIILATSSNGMGDSGQFLNQLIKYDEGTLTPTHFVQSMPNSVGSMLAILTKTRAYNNTHVQMGNAFENALIDAQLCLLENEGEILVGDIEELSDYNYRFDMNRNRFKETPVASSDLIQSKTKGTVSGEGSSMFIVSSNKENALAKLVDVTTILNPSIEELRKHCMAFLEKHKCEVGDIDALVLGLNGNVENDDFYLQLAASFPKSNWISYKQLVGEYPSSSSFATYMSLSFLMGNKIPDSLLLKKGNQKVEKILIYNNYQNVNHSFILLEKA